LSFKYIFTAPIIEALRSKLRRIFDSQGTASFIIRSLTPQQAAGNALATELYDDIFIAFAGLTFAFLTLKNDFSLSARIGNVLAII
jgi:hypothetical protein